MSIVQKILHAGEGKRLKAVQAIVPEINALEPEVERLSDDEIRARHRRVQGTGRPGPSRRP